MEKPDYLKATQNLRKEDFPWDIWTAAIFVHEGMQLLEGAPDEEKVKLIAMAIASERTRGPAK